LLRCRVCIAGAGEFWVLAKEERSGTRMAADLITVRGHRRPRLSRATTIQQYTRDIIVR
jgi:hypothetical protein